MQPRLEFSAALPFSAYVEHITRALSEHQVVIVSGETGSGKSTQLPKLCLAAGRGIDGRIGHTQPRRIAARAIARRIAEETLTEPGELVGHCVRFDDNLAPHARVKVMTDGILLNEIHTDPWLEQYDTLIIDEVHERSINIDVLLGYLQRVLRRRADLKLIVTSATFDSASFADFFDDAVHCDIPGRGYPVELRYRPPDETLEDGDINAAIIAAIEELDAAERGDILVFLPGEREIREAHKAIARAGFAATEILDLYARLGASRQARIFSPGQQRRIILATNVAETSLTVPRVRHVIDSGQARISRYSPRRKLQQLPVEKIARANADQRLGRCGREGPGICIRLYDEADYAARRAAVEAEIERTNLAGVILRLGAMGITAVEEFSFIERPPERMIKDGYSVLQEIGALDQDRHLTPVGRRLHSYPIDPRLARILGAAAEFDCLREALIICAAMSIADPRERPHEKRDLADRAHLEFADKRSDFMWFVNAWAFARGLEGAPVSRRARRCRRAFVSSARLQEWVQLHDYLLKRVRAEGLRVNTEPASYKAIHCALIAGFPSLVGEWQGDHYLGCRNLSFALHPGSILHKRGVKWLLVGDIVETGRPYARLAARIDPQWIAGSAGHLVKRSHETPQWDERRGCARVIEIQRLFGLVINASRQVELASIDPAAARELFIGEALIDGRLGEWPEFLRHNRALAARIQALEARARRRDLLAARAELFDFYARRIPPSMCTRRTLLRWLRADPARGDALCMDEADATGAHLVSVPAFLFPDVLNLAGSHCPLVYRFEPGAVDDGITVRVPLVLLPRLAARHFDRLVPGLLSEKVESLLRALPKHWRRHFSPVREFAMAAVEAVAERAGPLPQVLAASLETMSGLAIDAALFDDNRLEAHLRMRIEVVNDDGEVIATARDLDALRVQLGDRASRQRDALDWNLAGQSDGGWNFADIPTRINKRIGDDVIIGYPALSDHHEAVHLQVFDSAAQARSHHLRGVQRLLMLSSSRHVKAALRPFAGDAEAALHTALFGFGVAPEVLLAEALAEQCTLQHPDVRDGAAFATLCVEFQAALSDVIGAARAELMALLARGAGLRRALDDVRSEIPQIVGEDITTQLRLLLGPRAARAIIRARVSRYGRYLDAIERRIERLRGNPGKDLRKLERIAPLWQQYLDAFGATDEDEDALVLHGLFEEYRLAVFAPELGAAEKVSAEQLKARLAAARESA